MEVDPADGSATHFVQISKGEENKVFTTFGAVAYDKDDPDDGKGYYYTSFIYEDSTLIEGATA